jgi:chromosome segregation ATPase
MSTETSIPFAEAIRGTFREWHAHEQPLAAELSESLAALSAYQSHLDSWQAELAREREALADARRQFETNQAESQAAQSETVAATAVELTSAREKISSLTAALLARTDELRALDGRRAEVVTELELARAREKELHAKLEELKNQREQERAQGAEELRHLRALLECRLESNDSARHSAADEHPTTPSWPAEQASRAGNSPVLGSIVEQFGKLRQQRASDRPGLNKTR